MNGQRAPPSAPCGRPSPECCRPLQHNLAQCDLAKQHNLPASAAQTRKAALRKAALHRDTALQQPQPPSTPVAPHPPSSTTLCRPKHYTKPHWAKNAPIPPPPQVPPAPRAPHPLGSTGLCRPKHHPQQHCAKDAPLCAPPPQRCHPHLVPPTPRRRQPVHPKEFDEQRVWVARHVGCVARQQLEQQLVLAGANGLHQEPGERGPGWSVDHYAVR